MSDSQRDALAELIDPEGWELYRLVQERLADPDELVSGSREIADRIINSGILVSMEWDRREYLVAKERIIEGTSRTGKCYDVESVIDPYAKHDPKCIHWPDTAISGSSCIR